MNNFLKIYRQRTKVEIADRLKVLKQITKCAIQETLLSCDLVKNCKIMYINSLENYQD